jgi:hypothetical protein
VLLIVFVGTVGSDEPSTQLRGSLLGPLIIFSAPHVLSEIVFVLKNNKNHYSSMSPKI